MPGQPFSEGVAGAEMTEGMVKGGGGAWYWGAAEELEREEEGRKGKIEVGGR